ncbi:hypothetical protein NLU13_6671 [Sarocladium strictum]|uniref:WSC domain-containing protein n=1 Tax=Sarocladium strictum TaxID=5046 RepID=A0AA39GE45_SARSR|nr:hypothetical protein NLU13_6671 [Sarocladium strictum]
MSRHVLGMGLLAVTVAAQATLASSGFQYVGCVEADPKLFGLNIDFSTPFTPQQCQAACAGKATYTAIGGGCHCDVPSQQPDVTFKILDEAACAVLCIPGSPDAGRCGGSGEGETAGHKLYSLYKKATEARHAAAAAHKDEDCDKEEDAAVAAAANMIGTVSVVIQTVYSCPPQKEDCPLPPSPSLVSTWGMPAFCRCRYHFCCRVSTWGMPACSRPGPGSSSYIYYGSCPVPARGMRPCDHQQQGSPGLPCRWMPFLPTPRLPALYGCPVLACLPFRLRGATTTRDICDSYPYAVRLSLIRMLWMQRPNDLGSRAIFVLNQIDRGTHVSDKAPASAF